MKHNKYVTIDVDKLLDAVQGFIRREVKKLPRNAPKRKLKKKIREPSDAGLLRPADAAEFLGLKNETILASWRARGMGPAFVRLDKRRLGYRKEDLEAYRSAGKVEDRATDQTAQAMPSMAATL